MTYQEFRDSSEAKLVNQYYRVTALRERDEKLVCWVLQWEPSNVKWYRPEPYSGRKDCGYTNEVWEADDGNLLIMHIRPL